ncbi:MAG TPA: magnesium and cobalt transport protein CorA [Desulfobulbaceae bacterium]|nr:magnesium and cobalt transport protein CorA [Desulfobulbaceae bacterium]
MINYFVLEHGRALQQTTEPDQGVFWVDIISPTEEEQRRVEQHFGVELFTRQESEEIESSSRYIETEEEIGVNINFLFQLGDSFSNSPVSFILKDRMLFTQRSMEFHTFTKVSQKLRALRPTDGREVFLAILAMRIDFDADFIEHITAKINMVSDHLVAGQDTNRDLLLKIAALQTTTISIRENIIEKQRILSSLLRSKLIPKDEKNDITIMIKDVNSLLDHASFNFERLEFLQNTFIGLVGLEESRTIKIFTVVTVMFMPPTLIGSLYGMNFDLMPELHFSFGYPMALGMMVLSSCLTLLLFRLKKLL